MHGNFRNDTKRALTKYGGGGGVVIEYSLYEVVGLSTYISNSNDRAERGREKKGACSAPRAPVIPTYDDRYDKGCH